MMGEMARQFLFGGPSHAGYGAGNGGGEGLACFLSAVRGPGCGPPWEEGSLKEPAAATLRPIPIR
jgi:hypothetical protein